MTAPAQPRLARGERMEGDPGLFYRSSLPFPFTPFAGSWVKVLVGGKPFGARRPASARLPRQSASSFSVSEKARPAVSVHDSPSAAVKVLTSESPPSL